MSMNSNRLRLAGAVAASAAILVLSGVSSHRRWDFIPPSVSAQDEADVRAGVAILANGKTPLTGFKACDAIKGLMPDKFTAEDGVEDMKHATSDDVVICFRGGFDEGDALSLSIRKHLFWQRGLAGTKIVVLAPNRERFLAVAKTNGLKVGEADLRPYSETLQQLQSRRIARRDGPSWLIAANPGKVETFFGPYVDLSPGRYTVSLTLEPVDPANCAALSSALQVSLSVTGERRQRVLSSRRSLSRALADAAHCRWTAVGQLEVPTGGVRSMETPVWVTTPVAVRLVDYQLIPLT